MSEATEQQAAEMVERVARVINPHYDAFTHLGPEYVKQYQDQTRSKVRAIFAAMREPTPEMTRACLWPATDWNSTLEEVWSCMIDGAIGNAPPAAPEAPPAPDLSSEATSGRENEMGATGEKNGGAP